MNTRFLSHDVVLSTFDHLCQHYDIVFLNRTDERDIPVSVWLLTDSAKRPVYTGIFHDGMLVGFCYNPTNSWTFVKGD